jgi:hypothetical protein
MLSPAAWLSVIGENAPHPLWVGDLPFVKMHRLLSHQACTDDHFRQIRGEEGGKGAVCLDVCCRVHLTWLEYDMVIRSRLGLSCWGCSFKMRLGSS